MRTFNASDSNQQQWINVCVTLLLSKLWWINHQIMADN